MLDPRYKKLIFKYDNMLPQAMRDDAVKWLTEEYVKTYKGKFGVAKSGAQDQVRAPQLKRRKVSAATIFDEESSEDEPIEDELAASWAAYLALPQAKFKSEWGVQDWWRDNAPKYPNLEVMARQYLGCPSTSATVERLFSAVGIAFSDKRKSSHSKTIADIMFGHANLP